MQFFRIGPNDGAQRVGYARDAFAELQRLRGAIPDTLTINTWEVSQGGAMLAEHLVSRRLASLSKGNGWYAVSVAGAKQAIEAALKDISADAIERMAETTPAGDYSLTMVHLRTQVFRTTQAMMATIAGRTPGVISKWESGMNKPGFQDLLRLRSYARALDLPWEDSFLLGINAATPHAKGLT